MCWTFVFTLFCSKKFLILQAKRRKFLKTVKGDGAFLTRIHCYLNMFISAFLGFVWRFELWQKEFITVSQFRDDARKRTSAWIICYTDDTGRAPLWGLGRGDIVINTRLLHFFNMQLFVVGFIQHPIALAAHYSPPSPGVECEFLCFYMQRKITAAVTSLSEFPFSLQPLCNSLFDLLTSPTNENLCLFPLQNIFTHNRGAWQ